MKNILDIAEEKITEKISYQQILGNIKSKKHKVKVCMEETPKFLCF